MSVKLSIVVLVTTFFPVKASLLPLLSTVKPIESGISLRETLLPLSNFSRIGYKNYPAKADITGRCLAHTSTMLPGIYVKINKGALILHPLSQISANDIGISGKVLDEKNERIPGATVRVKETNLIAITDEKGEFRIKGVREDASIIVTSIGYNANEIKVSAAPMIIKLTAKTNDLDNVIIVAYGSQNKRDVISSVSQVNGEEIRKSPSPNLQNMLQGKLTGYTAIQRSGQPGNDAAAFYIRGVISQNNSQPLVVIDDIQSDYDQFSNINPNEVESVSILKDATSTAMYGVKGANGVILVTTRRGREGKAKINFTTQAALQTTIRPQKFLGSYDSGVLLNEAIKNNNTLTNSNLPLQFSDADLRIFQDGSDPYRHPDVDWYHTLFKPFSLMSNNNIDISGGTDRVKFFVSLGQLWQNGNLNKFTPPAVYRQENINSTYYYKRYNFRSNLDIKATSSLSFRIDLSGNTDEKNSPAGANPYADVASVVYLAPYVYSIYNPDGTYGYNDGSFTKSPAENVNNIVGRLALGGYNRLFTTQFNVNLSAVQKMDLLVKGLSVNVSGAFTNLDQVTRNLTGGAFPAAQYDPKTGAYIPRDINVFRVPPLSSSISNPANFPLNRINIRGGLNYNGSFGSHNISAIAIYDQNKQIRTSDSALENLIPNQFQGYSFRVTYNYKHKYLFESTGAYNGSSRFVKHYDFFPSVSLGYNISEEPFFKKMLPFINNLKLKGSFGYLGSDDIAGFAYTYLGTYLASQPGYNFGDNAGGTTISGIREGNIPNENVVWERERKFDLGLDFALLNSKIKGSVGVFSNERYNILINRQTIPGFFGVVSTNLPAVNNGRNSNRGLETELSYAGNIGKVGFQVTAMYSYNKNKIIALDEPIAKYPWLQRTGQSLGVERLWIFEDYYNQTEADLIKAEDQQIKSGALLKRTVAVPSGPLPLAGMLKYKDLNGDGLINDDDRAYVGLSNIPSSSASLNLSFSYRGFTAGLLFQSAFGYNLRLSTNISDPGKVNYQSYQLKRWTPETAETAEYPLLLTNPGYQASVNGSTYWSLNTYYIRLRQADISYKFSGEWLKRASISGLRLFINGSNLYTWSNIYSRYQIDPEIANATSTNIYPSQRVYNIGLNVTL